MHFIFYAKKQCAYICLYLRLTYGFCRFLCQISNGNYKSSNEETYNPT